MAVMRYLRIGNDRYEIADEKLKVSEITSGITYYPILGSGVTNVTSSRQWDSTGLQYDSFEGEEEGEGGNASLSLGNYIPVGEAGSKRGNLILYGEEGSYSVLQSGTTGEGTGYYILLPDKQGTVALIDDIPAKVSQLENDLKFITKYTETDPTVPAWAKATTKPTYTAQEVGAISSVTVSRALVEGTKSATITVDGTSYDIYSKSGTITDIKTTAGAHTTVDVSSGAVSFNVPTTAAHVGIKFGYTTSGNNRAVLQDSSGNLYVTQKDDNTNTTYTLSGALASHKFTSTLTAGGSGSGTSISELTFVAGTGITLTDDATNKKITIAANNSGSVTSVAATGSGGITISGSPITSTGTLTIGLNLSTAINGLSEGTSPAQLNDYAVVQYAGGGTTTTTYHRRKLSNLIVGKAVSDQNGLRIDTGYLKLTGGSVTGPTTFGDTVLIDDLNTGQLIVNGNASIVNTLNIGRAINHILTGTGTAGSDKGSGVSPRYFPAKWIFNTGSAPTNGDIVVIKTPVAGHDYGVFLSIDNGSHYHPITLSGTGRLTTHWPVGSYVALIFDSNNSAASMFAVDGADARSTVTGGTWRSLNYYSSGNTYTQALCTTAAATAAKGASMSYYVATANRYVMVNMYYANTSATALTLNINGTGAKPIYINGSASSTSNYTLPAGSYLVFYDGTNYHFRTDNYITGNITGHAYSLRDKGNGTATTVNYSSAGMTSTSWFAAWDGYNLRAINPAHTLSTIGALPLVGGTMTGNINLKNSDIDASKANNNVSSTVWPTTFNIQDTGGRIMGRVENIVQADGKIGLYAYVRNYDTSGAQVAQKGIGMYMAKDGTFTYSVSDPAKFTSAISALPLAGGTMTGDLLFSDSGTNIRQIRGIAGANDYWRIAGGATASNAGWMEIATADDGTEPIYVRQYTGAYTTIKRTLTLLDANGDSQFPGSITVQKTTAATNTYADANPKVIFSNVDASQNISLTFTDYDSVQSPASLTLNGNQGNEYFIAPNIKATGSFYGSLSGHASLDLPLTGGTLSGAVNFANNTYNKMGDDAQIGDVNQAGKIGIKGLNGATGIYFAPYSGSVAQTITIDGAGAMTISGTTKIEKINSLNSNYQTINCDVSQAEIKAQNSNLTTSSADTDWFQALVKAICVKYPNISSTVFKGVVSPNSVRFYEIYIYNTSTVDSTTKLPQHSFGRALNYGGGFSKFGTDSYTWRFGNVDSNTTYSSLTAASGGTAVSLVTTGEKYTWNSKTSNTGTVTSITLTQGDGISIGSSGTAITTSGTRTIALATSGATAGSYGPSANASPSHGGTFSVPYVTVDKYGRITAVSTKTITLPADSNTDTKVTQTVTTSNASYPILMAPNGQTATTTTTGYFSTTLNWNPSTKIFYVSSGTTTGNIYMGLAESDTLWTTINSLGWKSAVIV